MGDGLLLAAGEIFHSHLRPFVPEDDGKTRAGLLSQSELSRDFGGRQGIHAVGLDIRYQIYLRPDLGGVTLVGSTEDVLTASDPDHYAQGLSEEEIAHFRTMAGVSIPALARAVPRGGWAGIYDDTPDYHPILDRLAEGLYCAVGFSGHGFKLSPIVGQWMAQLILTGSKPADMQHFAFDRFAQGKEIRPRYPSGVLG